MKKKGRRYIYNNLALSPRSLGRHLSSAPQTTNTVLAPHYPCHLIITLSGQRQQIKACELSLPTICSSEFWSRTKAGCDSVIPVCFVGCSLALFACPLIYYSYSNFPFFFSFRLNGHESDRLVGSCLSTGNILLISRNGLHRI